MRESLARAVYPLGHSCSGRSTAVAIFSCGENLALAVNLADNSATSSSPNASSTRVSQGETLGNKNTTTIFKRGLPLDQYEKRGTDRQKYSIHLQGAFGSIGSMGEAPIAERDCHATVTLFNKSGAGHGRLGEVASSARGGAENHVDKRQSKQPREDSGVGTTGLRSADAPSALKPRSTPTGGP